MRLRNFINELNKLAKKYGDKMEVVTADNIPIVDPVFSKDYPSKKKVIITDGK